jgi:hypothetical protein
MLCPGLKRLGGYGYLESVEERAHGVIDASEYGSFHDPVGAQQCYCLSVKRLVEMMLERQCAGDTVGYRFCSVQSFGSAPSASVRTASSERPTCRPTAQCA